MCESPALLITNSLPRQLSGSKFPEKTTMRSIGTLEQLIGGVVAPEAEGVDFDCIRMVERPNSRYHTKDDDGDLLPEGLRIMETSAGIVALFIPPLQGKE